ncbi:hypothetical protein DSM43518_02043 [Mycobacterium marinum]|nr:hypothetical protein DSM43518_02043 [Mycobacterium marinum]
MSNSVEIRKVNGGWECDWGRIYNHPIGPLALITKSYLESIICGPHTGRGGGVYSAEIIDGRTFVHLDRDGQRWTWEVFPAHWEDGGWPEILVGRWPDQ